MTLTNKGLEVETKGVRESFPADFVIVDWTCVAVETFDDITNQKGYVFEDIRFKCYYYNVDNIEVHFVPTLDQKEWIFPEIEKDATNELNKQK